MFCSGGVAFGSCMCRRMGAGGNNRKSQDPFCQVFHIICIVGQWYDDLYLVSYSLNLLPAYGLPARKIHKSFPCLTNETEWWQLFFLFLSLKKKKSLVDKAIYVQNIASTWVVEETTGTPKPSNQPRIGTTFYTTIEMFNFQCLSILET